MNRNKRARLVNQRSAAKQVAEQKAQALENAGYGQDKAKDQQVDGKDVDDLFEYVKVLENRVAALEEALNLDINPR